MHFIFTTALVNIALPGRAADIKAVRCAGLHSKHLLHDLLPFSAMRSDAATMQLPGQQVRYFMRYHLRQKFLLVFLQKHWIEA